MTLEVTLIPDFDDDSGILQYTPTHLRKPGVWSLDVDVESEEQKHDALESDDAILRNDEGPLKISQDRIR
jgi:hypothetical protein